MARAPIGPYQLQAAIAAVHAEAADAGETDWRQILGLYELLHNIAPRPMVALNRIVAVAMVHGPRVGLEALAMAEAEPALAGHYRVDAVRAHFLDMAGTRRRHALITAEPPAARSASPSNATSSPASPSSRRQSSQLRGSPAPR